jgi:hypothetical protein
MTDKFVLNADKTVSKMEDLAEWSARFDNDDRRIARDVMPDGRIVSTVFLGLDHSYGAGPPMLFETMIFPSEKNFREEWFERCSTYAQAERQHQRGVEEAQRLAAEGVTGSDTPSTTR